AGFALRQERRTEGVGGEALDRSATRSNARSNALRPSSDSSAPISRAILMKRLDSAGSSGDGLGLRGKSNTLSVEPFKSVVLEQSSSARHYMRPARRAR